MTEVNEELLGKWVRKILRRIYGPVADNGCWRITTNRELGDLHKKTDIVSEIKSNRHNTRSKAIGYVKDCHESFYGKTRRALLEWETEDKVPG